MAQTNKIEEAVLIDVWLFFELKNIVEESMLKQAF